MSNIQFNEDFLSSEDVIEHLQSLKDNFVMEYNDKIEELNESPEVSETLEEVDDFDEVEEMAFYRDNSLSSQWDEIGEIQDFVDELEGYGDWEHGASLINRDHFEDYCKEMLQDCGDLPQDLPSYIESNINWGGVASDLEQDYTYATIYNTDYLMRM